LLRVVSGFSGNTITGACYAHHYGQVEDFSILFPASGASKLVTSQCGQTFSNLSGHFFCDAVGGAQDYQWEFSNVGLGYSNTVIRGSGPTNIPHASISGLVFGNTYTVKVKAKVAGARGSYGSSCSITLSAAIPTTQLVTSQCGLTFSNLSGHFFCDLVAGAQDYQWEFVNVGLGYSYAKLRGNSLLDMPKSWIPGLQNGITYNVRVRASVGGAWGRYGNTCIVTINTSLYFAEGRSFISEVENDMAEVNVYPNPSTNNGFTISYRLVENSDPKTIVEVYDLLGRSIIQKQITSIVGINEIKLNTDGNLPTGYYVIVVNVNNTIVKKKIVVK